MANRIDVTIKGLQPSSIPCVFRTVVLKSNIGFASQIGQEQTKYVIKWNFDLGGETVSIPAHCIFEFDGGQLQNGGIHWNDTKVHNPYQYETLWNITETGNKIIL